METGCGMRTEERSLLQIDGKARTEIRGSIAAEARLPISRATGSSSGRSEGERERERVGEWVEG